MGLERCAVAKSQAETDESQRRSGTQMETGAETDEIKYLKKEKKKRGEKPEACGASDPLVQMSPMTSTEVDCLRQ